MKVVSISSLFTILVLINVQLSCSLTPLSKLPPHSGYHGAIASPFEPFFEGWYLRITPTQEDWEGGSLAFIFHVFDPQQTRSKRKGVGLQVLTPNEDIGTIVVESSDTSGFRADPHNLDIKNKFVSGGNKKTKLFEGDDFFDLTARRLKGRASSSSIPASVGSSSCTIDFDFELIPEIGWGGGDRSRQYSTAGWLASFPVFEPHYQILISDGIANGFLRIQSSGSSNNGEDETTTRTQQHEYNLKDAKVYLEKNWGSSFPSKWWWIQANAFPSENKLCVTSTGAKRRVPLANQEEEVALVGIHYKGQFLPFPAVDWTVEWGRWEIVGTYEDYRVKLTGSCTDDGMYVRCPTPDGMKETALETYRGKLRVELYQSNILLVDETTDNACLEIGGLPWKNDEKGEKSRACWKGRSSMMEPIGDIVMNPDLERFGSDVIQFVGNFINIPGL